MFGVRLECEMKRMETIDDLKRLMPPPAEPLNRGSEKEWSAFQKRIGLQFPEDYFTVVYNYGSGRFLAGEFRVNNPFEPADAASVEREFRTLRENKDRSPVEFPFPVFPETGGLYPFGIDCNGNTFLWLTQGKPREWPVVCLNSEDYHEIVSLSLIEFLVRMATNQLNINRRKFWGNDVAEDQLEFRPMRPPARRGRKSRS
jgi:hypothetical protein